jgi:hypothetical protein
MLAGSLPLALSCFLLIVLLLLGSSFGSSGGRIESETIGATAVDTMRDATIGHYASAARHEQELRRCERAHERKSSVPHPVQL